MAEDKLVNESFDYSKEGDLSDKVVSKGEKPKLSPNPDGSGYVKQVLVSSDSTSGIIDPEENVLYILSDGRQFKYLIDHDPHFVRVENGPNYQTKDGGRETPHRVVTSPKEAFEKIFNGNVGFNGGVFVKGKKLEDYIDSQGGVTQQELEEAVSDLKSETATIWELTGFFDEDISDFDIAGMKVGDIIVDSDYLMAAIVTTISEDSDGHLTFLSGTGINEEGLSRYFIYQNNGWDIYVPEPGTVLYQHEVTISGLDDESNPNTFSYKAVSRDGASWAGTFTDDGFISNIDLTNCISATTEFPESGNIETSRVVCVENSGGAELYIYYAVPSGIYTTSAFVINDGITITDIVIQL